MVIIDNLAATIFVSECPEAAGEADQEPEPGPQAGGGGAEAGRAAAGAHHAQVGVSSSPWCLESPAVRECREGELEPSDQVRAGGHQLWHGAARLPHPRHERGVRHHHAQGVAGGRRLRRRGQQEELPHTAGLLRPLLHPRHGGGALGALAERAGGGPMGHGINEP